MSTHSGRIERAWATCQRPLDLRLSPSARPARKPAKVGQSPTTCIVDYLPVFTPPSWRILLSRLMRRSFDADSQNSNDGRFREVYTFFLRLWHVLSLDIVTYPRAVRSCCIAGSAFRLAYKSGRKTCGRQRLTEISRSSAFKTACAKVWRAWRESCMTGALA